MGNICVIYMRDWLLYKVRDGGSSKSIPTIAESNRTMKAHRSNWAGQPVFFVGRWSEYAAIDSSHTYRHNNKGRRARTQGTHTHTHRAHFILNAGARIRIRHVVQAKGRQKQVQLVYLNQFSQWTPIKITFEVNNNNKSNNNNNEEDEQQRASLVDGRVFWFMYILYFIWTTKSRAKNRIYLTAQGTLPTFYFICVLSACLIAPLENEIVYHLQQFSFDYWIISDKRPQYR